MSETRVRKLHKQLQGGKDIEDIRNKDLSSDRDGPTCNPNIGLNAGPAATSSTADGDKQTTSKSPSFPENAPSPITSSKSNDYSETEQTDFEELSNIEILERVAELDESHYPVVMWARAALSELESHEDQT